MATTHKIDLARLHRECMRMKTASDYSLLDGFVLGHRGHQGNYLDSRRQRIQQDNVLESTRRYCQSFRSQASL